MAKLFAVIPLSTRSPLAIVCAATLLALANPSHANLLIFPPFTPATLNYDTTTQVFTASTTLAGPGWVLRDTDTGTTIIDDILGTFSVTANISTACTGTGNPLCDATGTEVFNSGSFSWTGQSATLGIGAPLLLLSGTLQSFSIAPLFGSFVFDATVDFVHATLNPFTGQLSGATVRVDRIGREANLATDIAGSLTVTQAPQTTLIQVTEPSVAIMLLSALALMLAGAARRRT